MKRENYMARPKRFAGFPVQTFRFLEELERNNERDWFAAKRELAEDFIMRPAAEFVSAVGERLRGTYPELIYDVRTNGTGSMFRMNRDTRFTKDKSPYKTNLGFRFWLTPEERTQKRIRLYVHLDKEGLKVYGGEHCQMEAQTLATLRNAIANDKAGRLHAILDGLKSSGFCLDAETSSRVPRSYPADHPNAELLRMKSLFARSPVIPREIAASPALIDRSAAYAAALKPLNDWLGTVQAFGNER